MEKDKHFFKKKKTIVIQLLTFSLVIQLLYWAQTTTVQQCKGAQLKWQMWAED